eukprot:scaffold416_cov329-Pavlova_lutheri.AAC.26
MVSLQGVGLREWFACAPALVPFVGDEARTAAALPTFSFPSLPSPEPRTFHPVLPRVRTSLDTHPLPCIGAHNLGPGRSMGRPRDSFQPQPQPRERLSDAGGSAIVATTRFAVCWRRRFDPRWRG